MKIVAAFGPLLLAGALLRLLTIQQAVLLAGRRFGVKAHIIPLPQPAPCIDVDKPEDKDLVQRIFATGRSEISGSFGACRCAAPPISKTPACDPQSSVSGKCLFILFVLVFLRIFHKNIYFL